MSTALRLLPPVPPHAWKPEQIVLRPFAVFAGVALKVPAMAWRLCRRPRATRTREPFYGPAPVPGTAAIYVGDLETYRWRPRAPRLPSLPVFGRAVDSAPRKLRPGARPRVLRRWQLTEIELRQLAVDEADLQADYDSRPRTWGDCEREIEGPCPFVSCRHHLYLEVDEETGAIKLNFPDREVWELDETCSLRIADAGALSLEGVGALVNLTQERVSQIQESGEAKVKARIRSRS